MSRKRKEEIIPKGLKKPYLTRIQVAEAEAMYVAGVPIADIAKHFELKTTIPIVKRIKAGKWAEKRAEYLKKFTQSHLDAILGQSLADSKKALEDLRTIREKAFDAIDTDAVVPTRFSEASQAYIDTIETERKIRIEGIQLAFIAEVGNILREEVADQMVLGRIANRLRNLFQNYQKKSLPSGDSTQNNAQEV